MSLHGGARRWVGGVGFMRASWTERRTEEVEKVEEVREARERWCGGRRGGEGILAARGLTIEA